MHTQLKGRIIQSEGTSYLVLRADEEAPDWLWVKAVNAGRAVQRMRADEVQRCVPMLQSAAR